MAIPERFLEEIAARNEITDVVGSYVKLNKRSGSNFFGLCPFHSEKTPSFSVSPERQIYHCFGCGKGGGVISFIMEIENLGFRDAVEFLARRANMEMPADTEDERAERGKRERLLNLNRDAARFFHDCLSRPEGRKVAEYISSRGITRASATAFGLGAAPDSWSALTDEMLRRGYTKDELWAAGLASRSQKTGNLFDFFRNRFIFPLIDVRGSVVGFSGRRITTDENERKFIHSKETQLFNKSRFLFGLNLAKKTKQPNLILVEGNVDVITLRQAGLDNAVASLGTSLTEEQARMLAQYTKEVVIAYDSDAAGQAAAQRAINHLDKLGVSIKVLKVPGNKDPDEFIRNNGADAFKALLAGTAGHIEYRLAVIEGKYDLQTDEGRLGYLGEAARLLASLGPVEREVYGARAAEKARVSADAVAHETARAAKKFLSAQKKRQERELRPAVQPKEREIRYENSRSAAAEELLLNILYRQSALPEECEALKKEDFSSEFLGRAYEYMTERLREGGSLSTDLMLGSFTPGEVSRLASLFTRDMEFRNASRAMADCVEVIKTEKLKSADTDLAGLMKKYRESKGYGG